MFNIGPFELMVLVIIGVVVLGPERLPGLARDAAEMLRTLRDLATGARQQLRDELGPEFADVDLRNLNPRTALTRAVFGDEDDLESLRRMNPKNWQTGNARERARNFITVPEDDRVSFDKPSNGSANGSSSRGRTDVASGGVLNGSSPRTAPASGSSANGSSANGSRANGSRANGSSAGQSAGQSSRPRPRPRPAQGPSTRYDSDAT